MKLKASNLSTGGAVATGRDRERAAALLSANAAPLLDAAMNIGNITRTTSPPDTTVEIHMPFPRRYLSGRFAHSIQPIIASTRAARTTGAISNTVKPATKR